MLWVGIWKAIPKLAGFILQLDGPVLRAHDSEEDARTGLSFGYLVTIEEYVDANFATEFFISISDKSVTSISINDESSFSTAKKIQIIVTGKHSTAFERCTGRNHYWIRLRVVKYRNKFWYFIVHSNYSICYEYFSVASWRPPKILEKQGNTKSLFCDESVKLYVLRVHFPEFVRVEQPWTKVVVSDLLRNDHCLLSSLSGALRFFDGSACVLGGISRMDQRSPDENHANGSEEGRHGGGNEHPESPSRHTLLGFQVGLIAAACFLSCYLIFLGYQIANSGFDALDRGQKVRGVIRFWGGILLACGSSFLLLAGGFGLALGGGLLKLLS
ncbi:hypothetical protein [Nitratireductor mangrovi]|uniref:hypothetical protein n=1 Tax=Nitratireductor mangrovi TaxID=2599600 RepID=UPI0011B14CFA|nr:hypothetical protein [Nitratireductor mangrovi]